jgi:hypothetical protein
MRLAAIVFSFAFYNRITASSRKYVRTFWQEQLIKKTKAFPPPKVH